jgi:hypothetical protein
MLVAPRMAVLGSPNTPTRMSLIWTWAGSAGESIRVTAPLARWVTIANPCVGSAGLTSENTANGSLGSAWRSGSLYSEVRRWASSHSANGSEPGVQRSAVPS